jgi:hypothetical protein
MPKRPRGRAYNEFARLIKSLAAKGPGGRIHPGPMPPIVELRLSRARRTAEAAAVEAAAVPGT